MPETPYKRRRDLEVAPGTRALCARCFAGLSYMVNSIAYHMRKEGLCPECEADVAVQKAFEGKR